MKSVWMVVGLSLAALAVTPGCWTDGGSEGGFGAAAPDGGFDAAGSDGADDEPIPYPDPGPGPFPDRDASQPDVVIDASVPLPDGGPTPEQWQPLYPNAETFLAAYADVVEKGQGMTLEELNQAYPPPAYLASPAYNPEAARYFAEIETAYGLTDAERALLAANGFAVTERQRFSSFGEAYLDIFYKDLPVFISTDSILQALHRSFDSILRVTEESYLSEQLDQLLAKSHAQLPVLAADFGSEIPDFLRDVDEYLAVARSLLSGAAVQTVLPGEGFGLGVDEWQSRIADELLATVEIFGGPRAIDFSQFKPRGHYTQSEGLERYFKAMVWLGRIDLRIQEHDIVTHDTVFNQRQLLAAYYLRAAVVDSGAKPHWDEITGLVALMIGQVDSLDLEGFAHFLQEVGVESGPDLLDAETQAEFLAALDADSLGVQQICSHIIYSNPLDPVVTPLPRSFLLLGQRFTVDSHVFSNLVFDRIVADGRKVMRMLPSPLDAWFALGNDRALAHLQPELERWPYAGNLSVMRFLLDAYDPDFWQANLYNEWLSGLRALSGPFVEEPYPAPMKTAAYHDKLLHTQLASWSQLRHDTILYVKQSYTGYPVCEYPDGYVEPIPAFYHALSRYSDRAREVFADSGLEGWRKDYITEYFTRFRDTSLALWAIARKELDGLPLDEEQTEFIKNTIIETTQDNICALVTVYAGWYPRLFYQGVEDAVLRDPVVADLHTNPDPETGPQVLHAGTGDVNLMLLTVDTCNGPTAYAGPVFSYFERIEAGLNRLNDEQWESLLDSNALEPPAWTESFAVRE